MAHPAAAPSATRDFPDVERVAGWAVRRQGEGPPVLLLHGWNADSFTNWAGAVDALGGSAVLAPDLPGHGASRSPEPFSIHRCAEATADVCDALEVRDAIVVGYSMGGPVAQELTRLRPDLVGGLLMVATAARLTPTRWRGPLRFATHAPRLLVEAGITLATALGNEDTRPHVLELWRHPDAGSLLRAAIELARWDSRRWVGDLHVPAASIITTRDRAVPADAQRELADLLDVPAGLRSETRDGHLLCLKPHFGALLAHAIEGLRLEMRSASLQACG
jgi:pimeloyl-ACP methyl ester carboxylesterase